MSQPGSMLHFLGQVFYPAVVACCHQGKWPYVDYTIGQCCGQQIWWKKECNCAGQPIRSHNRGDENHNTGK